MEIIKIAAAVILRKAAAFTSTTTGGASSRPQNTLASTLNNYDPTIQDEEARFFNRQNALRAFTSNPAFTGDRRAVMHPYETNALNNPNYQQAMRRNQYEAWVKEIEALKQENPELGKYMTLQYNPNLGDWAPPGYVREGNQYVMNNSDFWRRALNTGRMFMDWPVTAMTQGLPTAFNTEGTLFAKRTTGQTPIRTGPLGGEVI